MATVLKYMGHTVCVCIYTYTYSFLMAITDIKVVKTGDFNFFLKLFRI